MRIVMFWLICLVQFTGHTQECTFQVSGQIFDVETKEPIPFVTVLSSESGKGAISDLEGKFIIKNLCVPETELSIVHLGYKKAVHHHDAYHTDPLIYLAPDNQLLESVVVEGDYNPSEIQTISVEQLDQKLIDQTQASNFGDLVSEISGVSVISTGQNIMKPIIHGLHSNRVLVINNGVRHEFQNWGVEHAPEIDATGAGSVQVVKGAATVQYGPDALGGVILLNPELPELSSHWHGEVGVSGATNGRSVGGQLSLSKGWSHFAVGVNGGLVKQGDLSTPDYLLTNTGKEEYSFSFSTKYHRKNFNLEGYYSKFYQTLGILRGSVSGSLNDFQLAIDRVPPANTSSFSYTINNPKQQVSHDLLKIKSYWIWDHQDVEVQYAFQYNKRAEYDVRRTSLNSYPIIDLGLASHSLDVNHHYQVTDHVSTSGGIHFGYKDNNILPGTRTVPFLPNYDEFGLGIYSAGRLQRNNKVLEVGLRFDHQNTQIRGIDQFEKRYEGELNYSRLSGSVGGRFDISHSVQFSTNLGLGWRAPNIWELYSFGKHGVNIEYGLWRYQEVNGELSANQVLSQDEKNVIPEIGYKWINSLSGSTDLTSWELAGYINYLNGYIYGKPAGVTSTVNGVYPYFIYDQTNALLSGFDLTVRQQLGSAIRSELQSSYVNALDLTNEDTFVEIPPMSIKLKNTYQSVIKGLGSPEFFLSGKYTFRYWQQPRTISPREFQLSNTNVNETNFDFTDTPDGFFLLDLGVSGRFKKVEYFFRYNNVLNQKYRLNTDRLRYYSDQIGSNLKVSVKYQIN
ncbi:MAG: cobalamin receptor protein [Rickettsiales bacterium]|nr:cobalamin receptor protein [Rickettsiales bacterium]